MRRMTYLIASSKFGGDGNLNKPNVLLTGILFNGAVALVVLTVERLRRLRRMKTTAMGGTPTAKEKMKPRDLDGT